VTVAKTPKAHYKTTIVLWTRQQVVKRGDDRPLETILADLAGDICQSSASSERVANPLADADWNEYPVGEGMNCIHDMPVGKPKAAARRKPRAK
jgi:hypothetical protein